MLQSYAANAMLSTVCGPGPSRRRTDVAGWDAVEPERGGPSVTTNEDSSVSHAEEPPERPLTMQDIARASGVSQSTVSRVLNDVVTTVPIAEVTRQRVLEAASRLGYRPNPLARGLRGAKTMLLGIIVREISDPFFAYAVEAVSMRAREASLQRRARQRAQPGRRGDRAPRRARDPPL